MLKASAKSGYQSIVAFKVDHHVGKPGRLFMIRLRRPILDQRQVIPVPHIVRVERRRIAQFFRDLGKFFLVEMRPGERDAPPRCQ
jgi:hypothetical protein